MCGLTEGHGNYPVSGRLSGRRGTSTVHQSGRGQNAVTPGQGWGEGARSLAQAPSPRPSPPQWSPHRRHRRMWGRGGRTLGNALWKSFTALPFRVGFPGPRFPGCAPASRPWAVVDNPCGVQRVSRQFEKFSHRSQTSRYLQYRELRRPVGKMFRVRRPFQAVS